MYKENPFLFTVSRLNSKCAKKKESALFQMYFTLIYWFYRPNQEQYSLKQVDPENGVTVVFDVLLESNFKMDEERLHIRAGARDLGEFIVNCVDLVSVG